MALECDRLQLATELKVHSIQPINLGSYYSLRGMLYLLGCF